MKKIVVIFIVLLTGGFYFYNTNWFQAFFLNKAFYKNIVDVSFDVTTKGVQTTIPIKFKYNTCYDLGIQLPGTKPFDAKPTGKGRLGYKFISEGSVIAAGVTKRVSRFGWSGNDHVSIRKLMVFDLPFPGFSKDLNLELEVVEPFSFMKEYKGRTSIVISPNYEPKFDKCYDEDLRIEH